jgi:hypothetical protein
MISRRQVWTGALALGGSLATVLSARAQDVRPSPHMLDGQSRKEWLAFLQGLSLTELQASSNGVAYRFIWVRYVEGDIVPMPQINFVEAHLGADGMGHLTAGWNRQGGSIDAKSLAPFETALEQSGFYAMPGRDPDEAKWLDYPPQVLMEAVTKGAYHFVHRLGGFAGESMIYAASEMLIDLAKADLKESRVAR